MIKSVRVSSREDWLIMAGNILIDEVFSCATGIPAPPIVYSMTAPKATTTTRILGECWNRAASNDKHNAIFITTSLGGEDSALILAVLVHEICHAYDDNKSGHGHDFVKLAKDTGLIGGPSGRVAESFTATIAGPDLAETLNEIIEDIGPIPSVAINVDLNGKKKQKNRQLLMQCDRCDFKFRVSQAKIDLIKYNDCLCCDDGTLKQEQKE